MSAEAERPLRVVVAEDSFLTRAGIVRVLENASFAVVGEANEAGELLAQVREQRPDVVITDIRMPPTHTDEGVRAAAVIRAELPHTGVLVLSQYVKESYALELVGETVTGVGYLLKDRVMEPDGFVEAVRQVARGGSVLDPEVSPTCSTGGGPAGRSTVSPSASSMRSPSWHRAWPTRRSPPHSASASTRCSAI